MHACCGSKGLIYLTVYLQLKYSIVPYESVHQTQLCIILSGISILILKVHDQNNYTTQNRLRYNQTNKIATNTNLDYCFTIRFLSTYANLSFAIKLSTFFIEWIAVLSTSAIFNLEQNSRTVISLRRVRRILYLIKCLTSVFIYGLASHAGNLKSITIILRMLRYSGGL